jgi:hypothetical protein
MYANDIVYSIKSSKEQLYLNEALILEVNISQIDNSKVMLFNFSPKLSDAYDFHQIDFHEHEKYHDLQHQYSYLIYPKKRGEVHIAFDMVKSITDDDKVAYSISGDRDNVKGLQKEDIVVNLEPLSLEVKQPSQEVDLIGDFSLEYTIDKKETEAFDPINLKVKLKGKGNVEAFELLEQSEEYKLFTQKPNFKAFHSKDGTTTVLEWDYAISAEKSFSLPKKVLKAFNPETERFYELTLPAFNIEVQKVDKAKLLDKVDSPAKAQSFDWSYITTFFSYLVVFLAGWLMPRDIVRFKKQKEQSLEEQFQEKIDASKTHKALLELLLLENKSQYREAISALEAVVYHNAKKSLSEIKKMI